MSDERVHEFDPLSDLNDPRLYISRELSWLAFNARVLDQARDTRWPLLERVKFLAIFGANLDEFFMIRVAGLHDQRATELESSPGNSAADPRVPDLASLQRPDPRRTPGVMPRGIPALAHGSFRCVVPAPADRCNRRTAPFLQHRKAMNQSAILVLAGALGLAWPSRCHTAELEPTAARSPPRGSTTGGVIAKPVADRGFVRMELLDAEAKPATWVLRGGPRGPGKMVFLHGMCGHGLGYAQAFQFSAAKWGTLIAPQADVVCGAGPWAKWSGKVEALDARIQDAFRALGEAEPIEDITVMGISQGATRAEELARRWPKRYTRLVSMAAPQTPSARGLSLRAAVMMAGERDRQDLMRAGSRALLGAGIPSTFMLIPKATHGAMGPVPEETMGKALEWLFRHSRAD